MPQFEHFRSKVENVRNKKKHFLIVEQFNDEYNHKKLTIFSYFKWLNELITLFCLECDVILCISFEIFNITSNWLVVLPPEISINKFSIDMCFVINILQILREFIFRILSSIWIKILHSLRQSDLRWVQLLFLMSLYLGWFPMKWRKSLNV